MRRRPGFAAHGGETRQVSLSWMGEVHVCFQQTGERTNKPKPRSSEELRDARRGFYYLLLQLCVFSPFAGSSFSFPSTLDIQAQALRTPSSFRGCVDEEERLPVGDLRVAVCSQRLIIKVQSRS